MKRSSCFILSFVVMLLIALPSHSQEVNKLSGKDKNAGCVLLYNGKNFEGMRKGNGTD